MNFLKFFFIIYATINIFENCCFAEDQSADSNKKWGRTWAPIIGFDSSQGTLLGGALFTYSNNNDEWKTSHQFIYSTLGAAKLFQNFQLKAQPNELGYNLDMVLGQSKQWYYGEGDLTSTKQPKLVLTNEVKLKPSLEKYLTDYEKLLFTLDYIYRNEDKVYDEFNNELPNTQIAPRESRAGLGLEYIQSNTNEKERNFRFSHKASVFYLPRALSNLNESKDRATIKFDSRYFLNWHLDWTLALHTQIGSVLGGNTTYVNRFSLGGLDSLRGYYSNRFRGMHYYFIQLENRMPISDKISGIVFTDMGDIASTSTDDFHELKITTGLGLRFALPPDYKIKLRLDLGFAKDQNSIVLAFQEAF